MNRCVFFSLFLCLALSVFIFFKSAPVTFVDTVAGHLEKSHGDQPWYLIAMRDRDTCVHVSVGQYYSIKDGDKYCFTINSIGLIRYKEVK